MILSDFTGQIMILLQVTVYSFDSVPVIGISTGAGSAVLAVIPKSGMSSTQEIPALENSTLISI